MQLDSRKHVSGKSGAIQRTAFQPEGENSQQEKRGLDCRVAVRGATSTGKPGNGKGRGRTTLADDQSA